MKDLCGSFLRTQVLRARTLAVAAVLAAFAALTGAPPALASLQQEYALFSDCPVTVPGVKACVVSTVSSGEFVIGSKTVPINRTVTLQGGVRGEELVPAADGNTLSKTPLQLPGGLIGLEVLPPLTEVTVTAELAGPVGISLKNFGNRSGSAVTLPIKAKLDNPALGPTCLIGSESEPVALHLTTGTTNPPGPNTPISGETGEFSTQGHGKIATFNNSRLVDNAFSAPGVNGCDGLLAPVVDPAVDLVAGLPAAAGKNTAIMIGAIHEAESRIVVAEAALPEFGQCSKLKGVKEGKFTKFTGHYNLSNCVEENVDHLGMFEWASGPGANHKFTGSSGKTTLETVGKAKVTCQASTGSGEYTGSKSATMNVTFTGCERSPGKEACHSTGAGSGEIVSAPLQGTLGFIQDEFKEGTSFTSVGLDLTATPSVLSAQCGASNTALTVTGSVIGEMTPIDKGASAYAVKFAQSGGKQAVEHFDGAPQDTLSVSFGSAPAEGAGLASTAKLKNEEPLEIKAEVE